MNAMKTLSILLLAALLTGCKSGNFSPDDIDWPDVDWDDMQPTPPQPDPDPDAWSTVNWTSGSWPRAAREPSAALDVIHITPSRVTFAHTHRPGWPRQTVNGVSCDAIACFFVWRDTRWHGGKFDWIRTGGQSVKTLANIHDHYGGLTVPLSGSRIAFAWISTDGTRRTNLAETIWP